MSILSSVVDWGKDLAGGIVGGVTDFLNPANLISTATDLFKGVGGDYLSNKYIGQPNAEWATQQSREGAKEAFDREYGAFKTRYQDTTADMRKAGLNPILAASGGFSASGSPRASMPQAFQPYAPSGGSTALQLSQSNKTKKEAKAVSSQIRLNLAKATESIQSAHNNRAQAGKASAQERQAVANMFKLEKEFEHISNLILETQSRTDLNRAQVKNLKIQRQQLQAVAAKLIAETAKLKQIAKVYNGPAGAVFGYANEIMRIIGIPLSAGLAGKAIRRMRAIPNPGSSSDMRREYYKHNRRTR